MQNSHFLNLIFKDRLNDVHVTSFKFDPMKIPLNQQLAAWKGNCFNDYNFEDKSNQYFTVSLFNRDSEGIPRRRKALFQGTYVIVLDDVKEKLPLSLVERLPIPTYILETSPGSEQWGYVLTSPATNRHQVENLLDGLVEHGVSPDGKDPGMRGVTRYVRLPEGYNTKKSKMINGEPFKCRITKVNPFMTYKLSDLAEPFDIDIDKTRREQRTDGAADVPDHPVLHCGLNIKSVRSDGRFDITCPWVEDHTKESDDGAAIFTNFDGTSGFKCHHGSCQDRTFKDVLEYLNDETGDFVSRYNDWKLKHTFKDLISTPVEKSKEPPAEHVVTQEVILDNIRLMSPGQDQRDIISKFLKEVEDKPEIDRVHYHQEICEITGWTKVQFANIIKDLRTRWYESEEVDFYNSLFYIQDQNLFYDCDTQIFYTPDAFQNSFCHNDSEVKKQALLNGKVEKVHKINFAPNKPRVYQDKNMKFCNTWSAHRQNLGTPGDCMPWLRHFDLLGWGEHKDHILKFMAYTILRPEEKINHILLLGGLEGCGKDFLLQPLLIGMGDSSKVIDGSNLLDNFHDYLLRTKYIHVNEAELGDHKQAMDVSTKLKRLAAAPPDTLLLNPKGAKLIEIQNIVNMTMTTNSQAPVKLQGTSRRFYAIWTDFDMRDSEQNVLPEWKKYFEDLWNWGRNGGFDHCIYYLRNCVDISDFKPGSPPEMTDFLRSIQDESKSAPMQTIEAFISNRIGVFDRDLITSAEASQTLRSGLINADQFMYSQPSWFTPTKVSRILREIPQCKKMRARGSGEIRVWAIRNKEKYCGLTMQALYEEYVRQKDCIV